MVDPVVMPPPDGSDCRPFVEDLRARAGRPVVADDLDKFPKGFREEVIKLVAASGHVLLASMTEPVFADSRRSGAVRERRRCFPGRPCVARGGHPSLHSALDATERPWWSRDMQSGTAPRFVAPAGYRKGSER